MGQRLDQLLQSCTVKVTVPGQAGWGTGFFVAPGLILTCAHVVKLAQDHSVRVFYPQEEQSYLARLDPDAAASQAADLALLRLVDPIAPHPCVYLDEAIALHDRLYSYGYPDDFAEGAFTTFESEALTGGNAFIKFKAGQVRPGMSGSPLLNQTTGKVCGIVKFTRDRLIDLGGGAIPATVIFEQFPALREQQQQFHRGDRRWSNLLNSIQRSSSPNLPRVWMVPASRNPFFTGRETLLTEMRTSLLAVQPTAFCGLGGMGKTQTAIEYAYRYREDYEAVLWVRAEQAGEFSSGLVEVAKALELPIAQERDETIIVNVAKAWLKQHQNWLLVIDNADDLTVVQAFLRGIDTGHILLTSRAQATGTIKRLEIQKMAPEEGALFLLRRAKLIGEQESLSAAAAEAQDLAINIATQMDGLPLALDQAGSFIEETFTSLEDYLAFYDAEGVKLLAERGELADEHPSVTVTFSLAFEKVMELNLAAADVIRACAFLAPDAILEELFRESAAELGDHLSALAEQPLELTKVFAEASRFSLLYRNAANRTFSIHRLVQQVLRARMSLDECRLWAERMVRAINRVFPESDFPSWSLQDSLCGRLLPHARVAITLAELYQFQFESVSDLLNKTAIYLLEQHQYSEAEPLFQNALALRQKLLGQEHSDVATSLNSLAWFYYCWGHHNKAKPLYLEALKIKQHIFGEEHIDVSIIVHNLGMLYKTQGSHKEAEQFYLKGLSLKQRILGKEHPSVAISCNHLANLYRDQGRFGEAESLYQQALTIWEQKLGNDHPQTALGLDNLATLYRDQGHYSKAEPLYRRVLIIWKQACGENNPYVGRCLDRLAKLHALQGHDQVADTLFVEALEILEQELGATDTWTVRCRENLKQLRDRSS